MADKPFSLAAIILAAGQSSRMGRPKLLLPWGETSILGHLITQWSHAGAIQTKIIHRAGDQAILAELDRLQIAPADRIENPDADRGMFSSVLCAAQGHCWLPSLTHWVVSLGDQPHLKDETLVSLRRFAELNHDRVCQPVRNGARRHPLIIPRAVFVPLAQSKAATLKEFLLAFEFAGLACEDPALDLDIDYPDDYQKALLLAGLKPASKQK